MKSKVHKLLLISIDIIVILLTYYISVLANELLLRVVDNLYLTRCYISLPIQLITLALCMCYRTSKARSIVGDGISVVISNLVIFVVAVSVYKIDVFDYYVYLISNLIFQTVLISVLHQIISDLSMQRNRKRMMEDSYSAEKFRTQKTVQYKKALQTQGVQSIGEVAKFINSNYEDVSPKLDDDEVLDFVLDEEIDATLVEDDDLSLLEEEIDIFEINNETAEEEIFISIYDQEEEKYEPNPNDKASYATNARDSVKTIPNAKVELIGDIILSEKDFIEPREYLTTKEENKQLYIKQPTQNIAGDAINQILNSEEVAVNDNTIRQEEMVKQVKNEELNELELLLNKLRINQEVIDHRKTEDSSLPEVYEQVDSPPQKEETMQDKLDKLNDMFNEFSTKYLSICEDNPDIAKQQLFNLLGTLEPELLENDSKVKEVNKTAESARTYKYHFDDAPRYSSLSKYSIPSDLDFAVIENSYRDNISDKTPLYDSSEYYDAYTKHIVENSQNNEKEVFYDIDDFNISDIIMDPNYEIKIKKAKTEKTRQQEKENLERLLRKNRENQGVKVRTVKPKSDSSKISKAKEQTESLAKDKEVLDHTSLNEENLDSKPVKNSDDMTMKINNEPKQDKKTLKKSILPPKVEESKPIDLENFEHLDEPIQNHIDISDVYDESVTLESLLASVLEEIGNVESRIAKMGSSYEDGILTTDAVALVSVEDGVTNKGEVVDESSDEFGADEIGSLISEDNLHEIAFQSEPTSTGEKAKKKADALSNSYLSDDDLDFISDLLDSL